MTITVKYGIEPFWDLTWNVSTEIERKTIQGKKDPKRHLKATAQPGGHAAGAGEYSNVVFVCSGRRKLKIYANIYTAAIQSFLFELQYKSSPLFVLLRYTGDAGEVEAAADLLLKSLLKRETLGLHLLEGWCIDMKYLWLTQIITAHLSFWFQSYPVWFS